MSTQHQSSSSIVKIRTGLGLPPVKGPSVAGTNGVLELVRKMEYWLPG